MNDETPGIEERAVRITTDHGCVEGYLRIGSRLRTLDDLNMVSKRFITIHDSKSTDGAWQLSKGPLAINKDSILFVQELSPPPPSAAGRFGAFSRAAVRLKMRAFEVEGFLHVPPGGVVMKRLDQGNHSFVPLTSVLISGPGEDEAVAFLALNRNFITAAQVSDPEDLSVPSFTEAEIQQS